MKRFFLFLVVLACMAGEATACNRCGLLGRRCRYSGYTYAHSHSQPQTYAPSNVYVVQNSYPPPLVAQGATSYVSGGSFQNVVLPLLDPNSYFSQELQLMKAAQEMGALRTERSQAMFERIAALQAPALERLAIGQAAQMVLQSSGLDSAHNQQALTQGTGTAQAVIINRDINGKLQVVPIANATSVEIQQLMTNTATGGPPPVQEGKWPNLTHFCLTCHGTHLAQPKGGFFMGEDPNVAAAMEAKFFKITMMIRDGKMPPAKADQPTDEQRRLILNEIAAIISKPQPGGGQ